MSNYLNGYEKFRGDGLNRSWHENSSRPLKVLVLDEEIPYPPNSGKRIRTWNLLRRLARRHSVCLLCYGRREDPAVTAVEEAGIRLRLVEPQAVRAGLDLYSRLLANVFSTFPHSVTKHYSARFQRELDSLLQRESWDLIQCEWTPYARFVSDVRDVPILIASHNVESQIWERRARHAGNPLAKLFFRTQEWKMRRFERRAMLRASAVTAVTPSDVDTLHSWSIPNITLVPNGVDLDCYSPAPELGNNNEILFLASLDWHPNVDALNYFVSEIFPLVREKRPETVLRIVGRQPAESLRKQLSGLPEIDFVGEVESVHAYLDRAAVVVVPLRIGGGSRLKILEALGAGKAVVSTSIGAEGLEVVPGEHLSIADTPAEFARRTEELLASPESRRRFGNCGRKLVIERYGWDSIAQRLESVWHATSANPAVATATSSANNRQLVTP